MPTQEQDILELMRQVSEHTAEIVIQVIAKRFKLKLNHIRQEIQNELENCDNKANKSPKETAVKKTILY